MDDALEDKICDLYDFYVEVLFVFFHSQVKISSHFFLCILYVLYHINLGDGRRSRTTCTQALCRGIPFCFLFRADFFAFPPSAFKNVKHLHYRRVQLLVFLFCKRICFRFWLKGHVNLVKCAQKSFLMSVIFEAGF